MLLDTISKNIVFFDGVCHLCNSSVLWILKHVKKKRFFFSPIQSELAISLLKNNLADIQSGKTIIYFRNGQIFTKSNAILNIAYDLGLPYSLAISFKIIPLFVRNYMYDYISKNRYKWFGKYDQCAMPKPEWANRFL